MEYLRIRRIGASDRCEATAPCLLREKFTRALHQLPNPCQGIHQTMLGSCFQTFVPCPQKGFEASKCTNVQRLQHISALRRYVNQLHLLPLCRLHDLLWQVARRTVQQQDTLFAWIQLQHLTNVSQELHQVRSRSPCRLLCNDLQSGWWQGFLCPQQLARQPRLGTYQVMW